jgi:hypothetical protein
VLLGVLAANMGNLLKMKKGTFMKKDT